MHPQRTEVRIGNEPFPIPSWYLIAGLVAVAAAVLAAASAFRLPPVESVSAPPNHFSAERAARVLRSILGTGAPHPMGTAANAAVRDSIVSVLRAQGYEPEVQTRWASTVRIGMVQNIVTRLRGMGGPPVLLTAHYDSTPASPGSADDGMGVAIVLEVARALKYEARPQNDIVFLLSDGEEYGFLGASAFQVEHPGTPFKGVVNIDSGDAAGPFWISERANLNPGLARVIRDCSHPMFAYWDVAPEGWIGPHNNDFKVYGDAGWNGVSLLTYRLDRTYHTPLDNVDSVDWHTVQHGGDTALALVRGFASSSSDREPGQVAMIDFLGRFSIWWHVSWSWAVLAGAAGMLGLALAAVARTGALRVRGALIAVAALPISLLVAAAVGCGVLYSGISLNAPGVAATWGGAVLAGSACFRLIARRSGPWDIWAAVMTFFLLTGTLLFAASRPLGHAFLLPVLCGALPVIVLRKRLPGPSVALAAATSASLCAVVLFTNDLYAGLYAPLGLSAGCAFVFMIVAPVLPLAGSIRARTLGAIASGLILVAVLGMRRAPLSHCSLGYFQDGATGRAEWQAGFGDVPPVLRPQFAAAHFGATRTKPLDWWPAVFAAPAPRANLPAPDLIVIDTETKGDSATVAAHLRSNRNASFAFLLFPPDSRVEAIEAGTQMIRPRPGERDWKWASVQTLPPEGLDVKVTFQQRGPLDVIVQDGSWGLPEFGRALMDERSRIAVPYGPGDMTTVWRSVRLFQGK